MRRPLSTGAAALAFAAGAAAVALAVIPAAPGPLAGLHDPRERHLAHVRQLTFGGQNAEAYWSFDGKKIIFQSKGRVFNGEEIKADQIFTMNADGTDLRMVSTGKGRCTCAYFLKGDREIIFSSTHGFSPDLPAEPDRSRGYVWPVYPTYAIYRAAADGSNLRPLFPPGVGPGAETGYNAESTVSPDGERIIFTSSRDGDLELYTMRSDGTDMRRLTRTPGYDGGAFYSADGKKIVWRAHHPETDEDLRDYRELLARNLVRPTTMELWVADADGAGAREVTHNRAANFAPFFFPDGRRIIFSSNLDDAERRRFELYSVAEDGTGLERVTWGGQFDAFPMFSPDGRKLVWASNRNGKQPHETNIFTADWVP